MEAVLVIVIGFFLIIAAVATFTGMTLYDIRKIRLDARLARDPNARFRTRPLVSVIVTNEPSDECAESLWNSDYQKIEVTSLGHPAQGKLLLLLPSADIVLDRTAISTAVHMLNSHRTLTTIELQPVLKPAQTPSDLMRSYHRIATAPFVLSRAGLGISASCQLWPTLTRPGQKTRWRTHIYKPFCWLARFANFIVLLYVFYLATVLSQPVLFVAYLCVLAIWMMLAITQYPAIHLRERLIYLLLLPVALGYLALLTLRSPFLPLVHIFKKSPFSSVGKGLTWSL